MSDDHRQRIRVLGAYVDEVNVEPINVGDEVGQGVEPRFPLRQSCSVAQ